MRISRRWAFDQGILIAIVLGPMLVALAVRIVLGDPRGPTNLLFALAAIAVVIFAVFAGLASRSQKGRSASRLDFNRREVTLGLIGIAFLVVAELLMAAAVDWRALGVFAVLPIGWILFWTAPVNRRGVRQQTIDVRCTPQAAFELVSNPENWPAYNPNIELVRPLQEPIHVGSVIQLQARHDGKVHEGAEEVVAFEPGKRFASGVMKGHVTGTDSYDLEPSPRGTRITYRFRFHMSLPMAAIGGGLLLRSEAKKLMAEREVIMERIKGMLEAPEATSV